MAIHYHLCFSIKTVHEQVIHQYLIKAYRYFSSKDISVLGTIEYVIVRITDSVERITERVAKTVCSPDCWKDHSLVVSNLNHRIQPRGDLKTRELL